MSSDPSVSSISRKRQPPTCAGALATTRAEFLAAVDPAAVVVHGVDFSSAPRRAKPIMVASGQLCLMSQALTVHGLLPLASLGEYAAWLQSTGPCLIGFDLPFGLPRQFVASQSWPLSWSECLAVYTGLDREVLRSRFKSFCNSRPVGSKFAHRETDRHAGSSPSMKWVNPPVAWMLHAGVPPIIDAGLTIPGMLAGDPARVALEAYPGLLARSVTKASYKSDNKKRQTVARHAERANIIKALIDGTTQPGLATALGPGLADDLLADGSADQLDAALCLVQAAWGLLRDEHDRGLKPCFDPLEGWIAGGGLA